MAQQPLVGHGLLIIEASRSHWDTPHLVRLLWTSHRPVAETSTWQCTTVTTDKHPTGFEITIPASELPQIHVLDRAIFEQVTGLFVLERRLKFDYYLHFLQAELLLLTENVYLQTKSNTWTQHDSVLPLTSVGKSHSPWTGATKIFWLVVEVRMPDYPDRRTW
jgi:hypothetical protein